MTDSINSISANTQNTQSSGISDATKKKLQQKGINPNSVKTEAEAQMKLQEAEEKEAQKNAQVQGGEPPQQQNMSNQETISAIKTLATKIGVSYTDQDSVDDILSNISAKFDELMGAVPKDSPQAKQYETLHAEYQNLYNLYNQAQTGASLINSSLTGLANYNQVSL